MQDLVKLSAYLSYVQLERQAFSLGDANNEGIYGHLLTQRLVESSENVVLGHG